MSPPVFSFFSVQSASSLLLLPIERWSIDKRPIPSHPTATERIKDSKDPFSVELGHLHVTSKYLRLITFEKFARNRRGLDAFIFYIPINAKDFSY